MFAIVFNLVFDKDFKLKITIKKTKQIILHIIKLYHTQYNNL